MNYTKQQRTTYNMYNQNETTQKSKPWSYFRGFSNILQSNMTVIRY